MSDELAKLSMRRRFSTRVKKGFRKGTDYLPFRRRNRLNRQDEPIEDFEGLPFIARPPPQRGNLPIEWKLKGRPPELIEHLDSIYRKAYDLGKPFFDATIYDKLKIRCEILDLKNDGGYNNGAPAPNFFDPFPLETLEKHPIITPDDRARKDYQSYEDIFDRTEAGDASQVLSCRLMWHFLSFRRNGITDGRGRLINITVWREAYVPHCVSVTRMLLLIYAISRSEFPEFIQEYFMPGVCFQRDHSLSPGACWTASTALPHIMCIVEFDSRGTEELLRGEILTVLATMITRLELDVYQGEVVIPVSRIRFSAIMFGEHQSLICDFSYPRFFCSQSCPTTKQG